MNLQSILSVKGSAVHTIAPTATLAEVVAALVQRNCGSLVVVSGASMVGIISERDIMRACADRTTALEDQTVQEVMSADVITGKPDDEVEEVMGRMTKNRIRHLPVLEGEKLIGIISIGDVVKAQHDQLTMENHYLKNYIQS